jgi:hypothetical protein
MATSEVIVWRVSMGAMRGLVLFITQRQDAAGLRQSCIWSAIVCMRREFERTE